MTPIILSAECIEFDPRIVRLTIRDENGYIYSVDFDRGTYSVLAKLPGFPPDPCA